MAALGEQTPDTGAVAFHSRFEHDPYEVLLALRPGTIGVVADAPDGEGLAGVGLMCFGECLYEGEQRPLAYLYSLHVHPRYRRQGLASAIAAWRVAAALDRNGGNGVIAAAIQADNEGSVRAAATWYRQRIDRVKPAVASMGRRGPDHPGWEVRPAREEELEELAAKQNDFYADYALYPTQTGESLSLRRGQEFWGRRFREHYVVIGPGRELLAGVALTEEGALMTSRLVRMPAPMKLANVVLRVVPSDGTVRRIVAESLWFARGQPEAARVLWDSIRWLWRGRGTVLMAFLDGRSPLARTIPVPRWMPSRTGSLVIRGPVPIPDDRLVYLSI